MVIGHRWTWMTDMDGHDTLTVHSSRDRGEGGSEATVAPPRGQIPHGKLWRSRLRVTNAVECHHEIERCQMLSDVGVISSWRHVRLSSAFDFSAYLGVRKIMALLWTTVRNHSCCKQTRTRDALGRT